MRPIRSTLAALIAILALAAVATASASAHNFRVEGKTLTEETSTTGTGGEVRLVWTLYGGNKWEVQCKQSSSAQSLLAEGKMKLSTLTTKECAVTVPLSGCRMLPETLEPVQTGQLATVKTALGLEFTGARKGEFAEELLYTNISGGSECSGQGFFTISGHWGCELHEAGTEAAEHEVVCNKVDSHLKINGELGASMKYSEKIKLVSGKKWSAV